MATNVAQPEPGIESNLFDSSSMDWSTAYAQLLSRSLASTQRGVLLYQQVLEQVSRGRLPSTVFQEYYPRFLQRSGPAYADSLTQLGARFLSRIAQLSGRDAARSTDDEESIAPPTFASTAPERWFEQYAEYAGRLNARALRSYRRQLEQVAAGEMTPEQAQQQAAGEMTRQMPGYLEEAGRLYLAMLQEIDELRGGFQETYLRGILALADGPAEDSGTAITLSAPLGGVAFASFTLANTTDKPSPIHYIVTEVRRLDGVGPAFAPQVTVTPEALRLGPGEEQPIRFTLHLDAARYDAEVPYIGFLYITGDNDLHIELQLRIVATQTGPHQK